MKHCLSIRWRLAYQFSIVLLLILCVSGGLVFELFVQKSQSNIDNLLFIQYKNIQDNLHKQALLFRDEHLRDETFQEINAQKKTDLLSIIINRQGKVIEKTSKGKVVLEWKAGYSNGLVDRLPYRFYMNEEDGMKVIVGESLESFQKNIRGLSIILFAVFGSMFLLSFVLSALFAKRALAPLRILHDKVRGIQPQNLPCVSLASAYKSGDEIGRLALTFDEFLAKLSQAFDREKQFTQDASHELRTPLTVMKSSLELLALKPEKLSKDQREKLATMDHAVGQMETLVNDLLFLSRGMGRPQEKQELKVATFLKEFLQSYQLLAQQKGLKFKLEILQDFELRTSPMALEKTVGNLVKNAIYYTDKGEVTVTVKGPDIQVKDTGVGIAEKDLSNIFKRFYQADVSRGEKAKGFGLGLAICRGICDREGWKIEVESKLGHGSVFTLRTNL
jgi:signal transduction histidine kinase